MPVPIAAAGIAVFSTLASWIAIAVGRLLLTIVIPFAVVALVWFVEVQTGAISAVLVAVVVGILEGLFGLFEIGMEFAPDAPASSQLSSISGEVLGIMKLMRFDECMAIILSAWVARVLIRVATLGRF